MNLNLIALTQENETFLALVSDELYAWVTSPKPARKTNGRVVNPVITGEVVDTECPKQVLQALAKADPELDIPPVLDYDTCQVDRALLIIRHELADDINGETPIFHTHVELMDFVKRHDIKVAQTFEGTIYPA